MLGQNLNSRRNRQVFVFGDQLIAPTPFAIQNTLSSRRPSTRSLRHIAAYFAQAEADLYNQFHLTAGVRDDGFSTFGAAHRTRAVPEGDAAWTFTKLLGGDNEGTGWLSNGNLRAAYGETGREPPVYATISALSSTSHLRQRLRRLHQLEAERRRAAWSPAAIVGNPRPQARAQPRGGGRHRSRLLRAARRLRLHVLQQALDGRHSAGAGQRRGDRRATGLVNGATITNKGVELRAQHPPVHVAELRLGRSAATTPRTAAASRRCSRACSSFRTTTKASPARSVRRRSATRRA